MLACGFLRRPRYTSLLPVDYECVRVSRLALVHHREVLKPASKVIPMSKRGKSPNDHGLGNIANLTDSDSDMETETTVSASAPAPIPLPALLAAAEEVDVTAQGVAPDVVLGAAGGGSPLMGSQRHLVHRRSPATSTLRPSGTALSPPHSRPLQVLSPPLAPRTTPAVASTGASQSRPTATMHNGSSPGAAVGVGAAGVNFAAGVGTGLFSVGGGVPRGASPASRRLYLSPSTAAGTATSMPIRSPVITRAPSPAVTVPAPIGSPMQLATTIAPAVTLAQTSAAPVTASPKAVAGGTADIAASLPVSAQEARSEQPAGPAEDVVVMPTSTADSSLPRHLQMAIESQHVARLARESRLGSRQGPSRLFVDTRCEFPDALVDGFVSDGTPSVTTPVVTPAMVSTSTALSEGEQQQQQQQQETEEVHVDVPMQSTTDIATRHRTNSVDSTQRRERYLHALRHVGAFRLIHVHPFTQAHTSAHSATEITLHPAH